VWQTTTSTILQVKNGHFLTVTEYERSQDSSADTAACLGRGSLSGSSKRSLSSPKPQDRTHPTTYSTLTVVTEDEKEEEDEDQVVAVKEVVT
jgi:hypothetical protein